MYKPQRGNRSQSISIRRLSSIDIFNVVVTRGVLQQCIGNKLGNSRQLTRSCVHVKFVIAVNNTLPTFACLLQLRNLRSAFGNSGRVGAGVDNVLLDVLDGSDKGNDDVDDVVIGTPGKYLKGKNTHQC